MSIAKSGPLTIADLTAVWQGAVDSSYSSAFIAAGEGKGFEAYTQGFAQYARVSTAIDVTTQACYVLPWSGQTNPPAGGAQLATVTLTFTRTNRSNVAVRLGAGLVYYDEQEPDWSPTPPNEVLTGLRFTLQNDLVLMPGDSGPVTATAVAEFPGYGYNNPQPGSIQVFDQVGGNFYNTGASVVVSFGTYSLIASNEMDMFIPQHVGQYVLFTSGANAGVIARMVSFVPPNASLSVGSSVVLEAMAVIQTTTSITTPYTVGEVLTIKNGPAPIGTAKFVQTTAYAGFSRIAMVILPAQVQPTLTVGYTLTGQVTGTVTTITAVNEQTQLVAETNTAAWRVLGWGTSTDLGLVVTNVLQPTGGVYPMLDGIGADKNLPRLPNETDAQYAKRISTIADVVTPNAIKRALNKTLGAIPWCLREVGQALLPGFFYDLPENGLPGTQATADYYDIDAVTVVGGAGLSRFFNGERVIQVQNGVVVRGRALVMFTPPTTLYVPGQAAVWNSAGTLVVSQTGVPFSYAFVGVAGIQSGSLGTFTIVAGLPIVGQVSAATLAPMAVQGELNPTNRWKVYLDYLRFRAYFIVGVPNLDYGDFGFFWGAGNGSYGLQNFYDLPVGFNDFYDGSPVGAEATREQVYSNIDTIRAGGVFWEMVIADTPCE
jgi:hypothetical protein